MSKPYSLIDTDTSPLFTLALAGSLDVLLRPGLPVRIPDVVFFEATRVHGAPGAEQIVEWINAHLDMVQIVPTDVGIDQQRRREEGRSIRGLGEQAAVEALDRFLRSDPTAEALLLFEGSDIERRRIIVDERVGVISTGDFLRELEAARLIQSTDFILDEAAAQGRNVERQRRASEDSGARAATRAIDTARASARAGTGIRPLPMKAPVRADGGGGDRDAPAPRNREPPRTAVFPIVQDFRRSFLLSENQALSFVINKSRNETLKTADRLRPSQHTATRPCAADQGAKAPRLRRDLFRHGIRQKHGRTPAARLRPR